MLFCNAEKEIGQLCFSLASIKLFLFFFLLTEFTWRRVMIRSSISGALVLVAVAVPFFQPVMSISGAVPIALFCIVYPIIIYRYTFKCSIYMNCLFVVLVLLTVVIMVGNVVTCTMGIIEKLSSR